MEVAGHPGAGGATDVGADVDAVGRVGRSSAAHVGVAAPAPSARRPRRVESPSRLGLVAQRRDHEVPRRVRVHVHHRERVLVAGQRRALSSGHRRRAARRGSRGEPSASALRRRRRCTSVRQPAQSRSSVIGVAIAAVDLGGEARRRSRRAATPRSGASLPRAFTPTVPCSTSSSPTTSTYGTFSSLALRMRAPSVSRVRVDAARRGSPRPSDGRRPRRA